MLVKGFRVAPSVLSRAGCREEEHPTMGAENAERRIIEKILRLPRERAQEVEDFIDFLSQRESERALARAVMRVSEISFEQVWGTSDDADYDRL
jgi:hypothetical protein